MRNYILLFLLQAIALPATKLYGQSIHPNIPNNNVYQILQDGNGNIWMATNQGLICYNGFETELFSVKNGMPFNDVFHLEKDPRNPNKIWYFSSGKHCGYVQNDSVVKIAHFGSDAINPSHFHSSEGSLWIESSGNLYRVRDTDFITAVSVSEYERGRSELIARCQFPLDANVCLMPINGWPEYVAILSDSVYRFDLTFNCLSKFALNSDFEMGTAPSGWYQCFNNRVLFSFSHGILLVDFNTNKSYFFSFKDFTTEPQTKYVYGAEVGAGFQISVPGHFWVLNHDFEMVGYWAIPKSESTYAYFMDRDSNVWVPDYTSGVYVISDVARNTRRYLSGKKVNNLVWFGETLFAGVDDVGYYKLEPSETEFVQDLRLESKEKMYGDRMLTSDKKVLISSGTSYLLDTNGSKPFRILKGPFDEQGISNLKDVCFMGEWGYAICNSEIIRFDSLSQTEQQRINATGAIKLECLDNSLYIGTTFGLRMLSTDSVVRIANSPQFDYPVSTMCTYKDYLLVGTEGNGVYVFSQRNLNHVACTGNLTIRKIVAVDQAWWLATDQGAIEVSPSISGKLEITNAFYTADGLIDDNLNDLLVDKGYLYSAGNKGVSQIDLNNLAYKRKVAVYFEGNKDSLEFEYTQNSPISISFSTVEFFNNAHLDIRYRLKPDLTWFKTTSRQLNFHGLAPGEYQLEVSIQDQHFNSVIKSVYIRILPLWWQTRLAMLAFVIAASLIVFAGFKLIIRKIRKNTNVKIEHSKKILRLELQALRSQMNPHFLYNSLNAIQYYIQRNEMTLSEGYLEKFASLIRRFFDYAHLQQITLDEEIKLLKTYLEIESLRMEDKLSYAIMLDGRMDPEDQFIPSMILQPIVENAINHGIFHKEGKGLVTIQFVYINPNAYKVIIEDDGVGIAEVVRDNEPVYGSTEILKERLKLFQESGSWKISYSFFNADAAEASNRGTRVILTIEKPEK